MKTFTKSISFQFDEELLKTLLLKQLAEEGKTVPTGEVKLTGFKPKDSFSRKWPHSLTLHVTETFKVTASEKVEPKPVEEDEENKDA